MSFDDKLQFTREMAGVFNRRCGHVPAPVISSEIHALWRKHSGNEDPYLDEKKHSNDMALGMYDELKEKVRTSADPVDTALRLAIAGNIIDYGASYPFDFHATIDRVLTTRFAIDHSMQLRHSLAKAKTILYLGDNSGEIVMDKLFIETVGMQNVVFAVRGAPVINDVTIDDARYVGMNKITRVIPNGFDAPSTILEYCSPEFREAFEHADLVISKGQGNFEGLNEITGKEMYFLLMAKCKVVAEALRVPQGSFIIKNSKQNEVSHTSGIDNIQ